MYWTYHNYTYQGRTSHAHSSHTHRHIRSRPGFKYKYHGLPKNNAFWPGAMLDKLRLCPPFDGPTPPGGPCSVHNIFQHVDPSRTHNRTTPTTLSQVTSWPSNKSGYVQFGSQDRKQYAI